MISFEFLLLTIAVTVTAILALVTICLSVLFGRYGIIVKAAITKVEEKEKYVDDTNNKQKAYDYSYSYDDCNGKAHKGKISKNTPYIEFNVGDEIDIIYIVFFPDKALTLLQYKSFRFLPWMITTILFVLSFILFINI